MASRHGGGERGSGRGHFRRQKKKDSIFQEEKGKKDVKVDESSPLIQTFRIFQKELDCRNDRHERIVKLSRDITIESKRIIFLLQRCSGSDEKESVLTEAAAKFEELHASKFYPLAMELDGQDPYQFLRAYSPGLQEYIEAVTFYHYLLNEQLIGVAKIRSDLTFTRKALDTDSTLPDTCSLSEPGTLTSNCTVASEGVSNNSKFTAMEGVPPAPTDKMDPLSVQEIVPAPRLSVPIPPSEYMLGVADFTGELMRMAINSVGGGDLQTPALVTSMMRAIHGAFTTFGNPPRELRQKTRTLSSSLHKVERACYTLRVRGSEIPKHMLADVFSSAGSMPIDNFPTDELDEPYE